MGRGRRSAEDVVDAATRDTAPARPHERVVGGEGEAGDWLLKLLAIGLVAGLLG